MNMCPVCAVPVDKQEYPRIRRDRNSRKLIRQVYCSCSECGGEWIIGRGVRIEVTRPRIPLTIMPSIGASIVRGFRMMKMYA